MRFGSLQPAAVLAIAQLLLPGVDASPVHGISRRADSDPGMGVELEVSGIILSNPEAQKGRSDKEKQDDLTKIKGAVIDGAQDKNVGWRRTAETTSSNDGISSINVEWIVDGQVCKLGQSESMVQPAVDAILSDLDKWRPTQKSPKMAIEGFDEETFGKWSVSKPGNIFLDDLITFAQQVTVPLPLEAVKDMACQAQEKEDPNPFVKEMAGSRKRLQCVDKTQFAERLGNVDVTDELMGFLSIILSYAKGAEGRDSQQSVKTIHPIMPRTDFVTMYKMVSDRLKEELNCRSLYEIIVILAEFSPKGSLDKDHAWEVKETDGKITSHMDTIKFSFPGGQSLTIKDWMDGIQNDNKDLLTEKDKLIDNQIGKLGSRTESVLGGTRKLPIIELRDLGSSPFSNGGKILKTKMTDFENAAVEMHKQYKNAPKARAVTRSSSAASACPIRSSTTANSTVTSTASGNMTTTASSISASITNIANSTSTTGTGSTSRPITTNSASITKGANSTSSASSTTGTGIGTTSGTTSSNSASSTSASSSSGSQSSSTMPPSSSSMAPSSTAPPSSSSTALPPSSTTAPPPSTTKAPAPSSTKPAPQPTSSPKCKRETTMEMVMRNIENVLPRSPRGGGGRGGGGRGGGGKPKPPKCP